MTLPEDSAPLAPETPAPAEAPKAKPDIKLSLTDNGGELNKGKKKIVQIERVPIPGFIQRAIGADKLTRIGTLVDEFNRKYAVFVDESALDGAPAPSLEQVGELFLAKAK